MTKELEKVNAQVRPPTPMELLSQAMASGADLEKMEKLMDLQERWEKKEAKKSFMDALSEFQTKVPVIPKKSTARIQSQKGTFTYKFANLGTISAAIKEALNICGLSYRWEFQEANGKLKVTCFLSHRDGHTETTSMEAGMDSSGAKNDIQQKGSTQTYLQRYTLIGALGLSTADSDIDGDGHQITKKEGPEMTEGEVMDQWQQKINAVSSRAELTGLYLKNRKVVDKDDKLKAMFKQRENQLPKPQKVELP